MKVDVEIEAARDIEDARGLRGRIGVGIGAAADDVGALLAGLDQQLLGAGIVGQAFLREHADLQVERPCVVALERPQSVKPVEADPRIRLDMGAHARRALDDGFLKGALRARVNVGLGEGPLGCGHRFDRFLERPALAIAAFENAGLVEVDMGLDEPGDHQPAVELLFRRVGSDMGSDVDDAAVGDADVDRAPHRFRSAGPDAGRDRAAWRANAIVRLRCGRDRPPRARDRRPVPTRCPSARSSPVPARSRGRRR